jgi:hypothetical protein
MYVIDAYIQGTGVLLHMYCSGITYVDCQIALESNVRIPSRCCFFASRLVAYDMKLITYIPHYISRQPGTDVTIFKILWR